MTNREEVISELDLLSEAQLNKVAGYLRSLRRTRPNGSEKNNEARSKDPIFRLGKSPVKVGVADASVNLDNYLYR